MEVRRVTAVGSDEKPDVKSDAKPDTKPQAEPEAEDTSEKLAAEPSIVRRKREGKAGFDSDLTIIKKLKDSRSVNSVNAEVLDIDYIVEDVAKMIATTKDHYKCIMFTDLAYSTQYKREMGHTKGFMRNRLFCDICERAVQRHGGVVVKRLGDGVMAVYEAAIDAVLAALLIKRSVHLERKKLKKLVGPVEYRIGITCGYVKELPGEPRDYIGHAMDKGARIQTMAHTNQVLIDEIVYGLIHTKIKDFSDDILIGAPKNRMLKGVGASTLYEVAPKEMGLVDSLPNRIKRLFGVL